MRLRPPKPDRGLNYHDIDRVTDRYLRRFDPFLAPFESWPHDSFHWANARAGVASKRVVHGFRNAGLSVRRLNRAVLGATEAVERFATALRR